MGLIKEIDRELYTRVQINPITARLVAMLHAGWFRYGRKAGDTEAQVRTGPLRAVSVTEVLNEMDYLRKRGFLGGRAAAHVVEN